MWGGQYSMPCNHFPIIILDMLGNKACFDIKQERSPGADRIKGLMYVHFVVQ